MEKYYSLEALEILNEQELKKQDEIRTIARKIRKEARKKGKRIVRICLVIEDFSETHTKK